MKNIVVVKIHNNSLGSITSVPSFDEGKEVLRKMAEEQLDRPLDNEELERLENEMEIFDDSDSDNIYTFSIGLVDG
jgi:hypothetical protein